MYYAGTKSARPYVVPSSEPQWGLTLIETPRPYSLDYNRRSRSDGRKLSTPSTSRTLAARPGEQWNNLLAGLDAPLACAPSWQIPLPCNSWSTELTRPPTSSPPGSSTKSCPTCGRFQQLRVTLSSNLLGRKSLLLLSDAWSQESLRDWIPSSRSLYSTPSRLSNFSFATSSLPHAPTQNSKISGEEHWWLRFLSQKSHWGTQRAIVPYLCCASLLKSSRDSSSLMSKLSSTHCSHRGRRASDTGGWLKTRSPCWRRTTRIAFQLKRRLELCLSTAQQPPMRNEFD